MSSSLRPNDRTNDSLCLLLSVPRQGQRGKRQEHQSDYCQPEHFFGLMVHSPFSPTRLASASSLTPTIIGGALSVSEASEVSPATLSCNPARPLFYSLRVCGIALRLR